MANASDLGTRIVLVGPMGAGKSVLGELLAVELGWDLLDSDVWLLERYGELGRALADVHGLEHLHALEVEAFEDMAAHPGPVVITPAESVVDSPEGRRLLSANLTVWIDASTEALLERRARSDHRRAMSEQEFVHRRESRRRALAQCSLARIDTTTDSPDESLAHLLAAVEDFANST